MPKHATVESPLAVNSDVWAGMFRWLRKKGAVRKYPDEIVVAWLLGYARTRHRVKRVLDVGCGFSQSAGVFLDQGFQYWGVDVTRAGLLSEKQLKKKGWAGRVHLSLFEPPQLTFPDRMFSHVISMEALHLNSTSEAMRTIISEVHRVLKPGGRFLATVVRPDYWFIDQGYVDWLSPEVIRVNERHIEKERIGATYFVFQDETHIRQYFSPFARCWIGQYTRVFGEENHKYLSYWIISAEK
ncbi:MAG: class I SAM-dependent methyltransferase [Thermodesulfobacteriota bacterium]